MVMRAEPNVALLVRRAVTLIVIVLAGGGASARAAIDVRPWARDAPLAVAPAIRIAGGVVDRRLLVRSHVTRLGRLSVRGAALGVDADGYARPDTVTGRDDDLPAWSVSFTTASRRIVVPTKATGARFRVRVGGAVTADQELRGGGRRLLVEIRFAERRERLVTLEMSGKFSVRAILTDRGERVRPAALPAGPRVMFFGDSYTAGIGAPAPYESYVQYAAHRLGWADAWASGSSLTGYCTDGGSDDDGVNERRTLAARFARDVAPYRPDVLVVAGGLNDAGRWSSGDITRCAGDLFAKVRAALPRTRLVVVAPWSNRTPARPEVLAARDAVARAAADVHAPFVDDVAAAWLTGLGNVGLRTGAGNADRYVSADGVHPSPAGHRYLGARLASALAAILE